MRWKTDKSIVAYTQQALLFLLATFFLAGCATKPWTEPLQDTEASKTAQLIDAMVARDAACGGTLEGDLVLLYQSPLEKKVLSGFLQFSMPASYKFVITNPFGQPVVVITGDKDSFQAINTLKKHYLAGKIRSFGLRNNIPSYFLKSNWGFLLTGRNQLTSQSITALQNDRDGRGIWLSFQNKEQTGVYHLLLDPEKEIFLMSVLENGNGKTVAEITYNNWATIGTCRQPLDIDIAGLDYGTDIHVTLSNILISDRKETYRLSPPPGYNQQYMP